MIELLKQLNYFPPNVKEYSGGGLEIVFDELQSNYRMLVNGHEWTSYNIRTHSQAYEVYSHYYFAKGHCICTGLGLGARESWLLKKDDVSKLTVIEKSEEVIEYHKINNPDLYNNIEIINMDALEYKGKCDTLLLDHYEQESMNYILNNASQILKNIDCNVMWIWTLEDFITLYQRHLNRENRFSLLKIDIYNQFKEDLNLDKLPEVTEDLLDLFYFMFNSKEVSDYECLSDYYKNNPRLLIGEAHR